MHDSIPFFVVTRLGVGVSERGWFDLFLPTFLNICLPSLAAQTDRRFTWFCACDSNAPETFKEAVKKALSESRLTAYLIEISEDDFSLCQSAGFDWLVRICLRKAGGLQGLTAPSDFVISGLIDGDDAWNRDTVAMVRNRLCAEIPEILKSEHDATYLLAPSGGHLLSFKNGARLYLDNKVFQPCTHKCHSMSIFVISRFRSGIFAASIRHGVWPDFAPLVGFGQSLVDTDEAMWIYTRHEAGMSARGDPFNEKRASTVPTLEKFGLTWSNLDSTANEISRIKCEIGPMPDSDGRDGLRSIYDIGARNFLVRCR